MDKELKMLKICLNLDSTFYCSFIILDDISVIEELKEEFKDRVSFVSNCCTLDDINDIKNRVMDGEKIILYNLDDLYNLFAPYHNNRNGITHFYQMFTETCRDNMWKSRVGQIHFVLSSSQLEQYYSEDNHFNTMLMSIFDLTKGYEKVLK